MGQHRKRRYGDRYQAQPASEKGHSTGDQPGPDLVAQRAESGTDVSLADDLGLVVDFPEVGEVVGVVQEGIVLAVIVDDHGMEGVGLQVHLGELELTSKQAREQERQDGRWG